MYFSRFRQNSFVRFFFHRYGVRNGSSSLHLILKFWQQLMNSETIRCVSTMCQELPQAVMKTRSPRSSGEYNQFILTIRVVICWQSLYPPQPPSFSAIVCRYNNKHLKKYQLSKTTCTRESPSYLHVSFIWSCQ